MKTMVMVFLFLSACSSIQEGRTYREIDSDKSHPGLLTSFVFADYFTNEPGIGPCSVLVIPDWDEHLYGAHQHRPGWLQALYFKRGGDRRKVLVKIEVFGSDRSALVSMLRRHGQSFDDPFERAILEERVEIGMPAQAVSLAMGPGLSEGYFNPRAPDSYIKPQDMGEHYTGTVYYTNGTRPTIRVRFGDGLVRSIGDGPRNHWNDTPLR